MSEKYIVSKSKLQAIADAVRTATGTTENLTLDAMAEQIKYMQQDTSADGLIDKSLTEYHNYSVRTVGQYAFNQQTNLTTLTLANIREIKANAFASCYNLIDLTIEQEEEICKLGATTAFNTCYHILGTKNSTHNPNSLKDGYIYVPASRLSEYKQATNWVTHSSQIIGRYYVGNSSILPDLTDSTFTKQTWYGDKRLTIKLNPNEQLPQGYTDTYCYCKLEA